MEYRRLGGSDLEVSLIGLGCNNFGGRLDEAQTRRVVHGALDAGVTLFDTADVYGNRGDSERFVGKALGRERERIVLASKFGLPMDDTTGVRRGARDYVRSAVEASLKRLGTDRIDLYQFHRPDPQTPIAETLEALDELVRDGKVLHVGCSTMDATQLREADDTARAGRLGRFVTCQLEYSLLRRGIEAQQAVALSERNIALLPYYPLANGLLTGKYADGTLPRGTRLANSPKLVEQYLTPSNRKTLAALQDLSRRRGLSMLELAIGWLAARPFVGSVIAGATTPEQVAANAAAAAAPLPPEIVAELDDLTADPETDR